MDKDRNKVRRNSKAASNLVASEEDVQLFRDAIGKVRRLDSADRNARSAKPPSPSPDQFLLDEARVASDLLNLPVDPAGVEFGEEISWLKTGYPSRLLRQLRRGQFSVRAEIDLHEMSAAVARTAINGFIDDCRRNNEWCVRIVHGKGLRSRAAGPVLKRLTATLLARRKDVIAYVSARPAQGGTGAAIVLLERD